MWRLFLIVIVALASGVGGAVEGAQGLGARGVGVRVGCAAEMLNQRVAPPRDTLGDLRFLAGRASPAFFQSTFQVEAVDEFREVEIEYSVDTRQLESRDIGFRDLVKGLMARARAGGTEQEVGALSLVVPGYRRWTVLFSSRRRDEISRRNHRIAMARFIPQALARAAEWSRHGGKPCDVVIERFHTHPSYANSPHSGPDIIQDTRFDRWLRKTPELQGVQFRSYVIPLFYEGEIYFEHEPRRHRVF